MLLLLPPETIEKVVAFVTAQESIGGPPPGLYALMRTCRYMHHLLSPEHNPGMFYRLFRDRFDLAAPRRRSPCLLFGPTQFASEAQHRFAALRLIRRRDSNHPDVLESLFVAYVMLLEDNGRNGEQLRWAGLSKFLQVYLQNGPDHDANEVWSLAVILRSQWLTTGTATIS